MEKSYRTIFLVFKYQKILLYQWLWQDYQGTKLSTCSRLLYIHEVLCSQLHCSVSQIKKEILLFPMPTHLQSFCQEQTTLRVLAYVREKLFSSKLSYLGVNHDRQCMIGCIAWLLTVTSTLLLAMLWLDPSIGHHKEIAFPCIVHKQYRVTVLREALLGYLNIQRANSFAFILYHQH